ncbi:MAG TPA: radical SAM protein [bacterium]|nr:radical SAM protein [bacterium]
MMTTLDAAAPPERNPATAISPEFVRLSTAAAIELGLIKGRFLRGCGCGCINLLQNYTTSCAANCSYCGLARERPGVAEEKSFIRVDWPVFATDLVAERIAGLEAARGVGRVCVSQVQDRRAYADLLEIARRVHRAAPAVPISALVSATTLDEERLAAIAGAGVDIIGVGLDAATPALFQRTRGKGAHGPHDWNHHWRIIRAARRLYGPMKVNCHVIVGLGETDQELVDLIYLLKEEQIACYLFSFNPEPGTAMQHMPRAPLARLRRVQLVKYLIERDGLPRTALHFDGQGGLDRLDALESSVSTAIGGGEAFMTNGCPDRSGKMACNRPYGSYRPGEPFRDYPFLPTPADLEVICEQMKLQEIRPDSRVP